MNDKGFLKRAGVSAVIVALTGLTALATPTMGNAVVNGNFSIPGLYGWDVSGGVSDGMSPDSGYAFFYPASFDTDTSVSTLSQGFTIPELARALSFDVSMMWIYEGGGGETDVFNAYLNGNKFYSINDAGSDNGSIIETFTYDISGYQNQWVNLVFELVSDNTDGKNAIVSIDNVSVLIPAPGALVLGLIGTGAVGLWRRRCV